MGKHSVMPVIVEDIRIELGKRHVLDVMLVNIRLQRGNPFANRVVLVSIPVPVAPQPALHVQSGVLQI